MASKTNLTQQTKQTQSLSLLQYTVAELLELPLPELEERVKNEMEDNSAIEEGEKDKDENDTEDVSSELEEEAGSEEPSETTDEMADYRNDDDMPEYLLERADRREMQDEIPFAATTSFFDKLREQIAEQLISEHEKEILEYLVGSLDDDGFLRKDLWSIADELAIYHNTETNEEELEHLLHILQTFEPRGIGARTPQECLHIQLLAPDYKTSHKKLALKIIDNHYDDFIHKRWEEICRKLDIDDATFKEILHELMHLNPRPGTALNEDSMTGAQAIIPDFFVEIDDFGDAIVRLNHGNVPPLHVSRAFRDSVQELQGQRERLSERQLEEYNYVRNKVEAAQLFIEALRRRHSTMLMIMSAIVERQRDFFDDDDELLLHPLTQKDISEQTGLAGSTVSRTVSTKYVQTIRGIYPLKKFFSGQMSFDGEEEISIIRIKDCLREIIEKEDKKKPLSDELLASEMAKRGFPIARRTVTKYRIQMNIPTARMRR